MTLDEVIQALRQLNRPVPRPPRLPTLGEVAEVEQELGVRFHPDFRRYLLEASDVVHGALEPVTITIEGSHTDLRQVSRDAWEAGVPRSLLPICEDNGDFFCMDERGQVLYWSHNGATDEKWPNLATWIKKVWIERG